MALLSGAGAAAVQAQQGTIRTAPAFRTFVLAEEQKFGSIVRQANIKLQN